MGAAMKSWIMRKTGRRVSDYIYVVNDAKKCWKVNYRTGKSASFENAAAAEAEDRKVFEKLLE